MQTNKHHPARGEGGFVLILTLVTLLLLTLFGVWALNSSDFEGRVANNAQQTERVFNVNEGANYAESSKIVRGRRPWFIITNPEGEKYKTMLPDEASFNPLGVSIDYAYSVAEGKAKKTKDDKEDWENAEIKESPDYWPWDNLEGVYSERAKKGRHPSDYRYLVTYLTWDTAQQGDDASLKLGLSSYKFRIQASAADQNRVIETSAAARGGSAE